ncbi:MAG: hypothetical protein ACLFN8_05070 [Candidatus Woesearchaeota archaeon]
MIQNIALIVNAILIGHTPTYKTIDFNKENKIENKQETQITTQYTGFRENREPDEKKYELRQLNAIKEDEIKTITQLVQNNNVKKIQDKYLQRKHFNQYKQNQYNRMQHK